MSNPLIVKESMADIVEDIPPSLESPTRITGSLIERYRSHWRVPSIDGEHTPPAVSIRVLSFLFSRMKLRTDASEVGLVLK